MPKLIVTAKLKDRHLEALRAIVPDMEVVVNPEQEELERIAPEAEIITGHTSAALIQKVLSGPNKLRWLQVWSAGVDKLPFDLLKKHNVLLTNASGIHAEPIAEVIFAMMLALSRELQINIRNQLEAKWDNIEPMKALHGSTIGILGTGAIGRQTAKAAKAFDMKVLGYSRSGREVAGFEKVYGAAQLHEMLGESDYVVNILPATPETHHLINQEAFAAMKPGAVYINVGRGSTTDTAALIKALNNGQVSAAGLDVFEEEPLSADSTLWQFKQVIITPHNAGFTAGYTDKAFGIFLPNLRDFIKGQKPSVNLVDLDLRY